MSIAVKWENPYADRRGEWFRGNLHTHTSPASGCGQVAMERVLAMYADAGYDFLSISDHMTVSAAEHGHLVLIPGVEWNTPEGLHAGVYSLESGLVEEAVSYSDQPELLHQMSDRDALVVLNHPNWQSVSHYRREQLADREHYDGIEIYNNVIERLTGAAIATDKWDFLLEKGRRVLGFASDDFHIEPDFCGGWICVRAHERSAPAILGAMRAGNFYCSSGVTFTDIRLEDGHVAIDSENAQEFDVTIDGGRRIARQVGPDLTFDVSDLDATYVRFSAYGPGASMAWTQPFFLTT